MPDLTHQSHSRRGRVRRRPVLWGGLAVFVIWSVFPVYWMLVTALKTDLAIYRDQSLWPTHPVFDQFIKVFSHTNFLLYMLNSLMVSLAVTVLAMIIGVLASYAISRLSFKGRSLMARAVVTTYLVPASVLFIPFFQVLSQTGLIDNLEGLVVVYLTFTVPFAIWMMMGYMLNLPMELDEAALMDGCTRLQSLVHIILPMMLPAMAVVALFAFTNCWNEFLYALVFIGRDSQKTITVGLISLARGDTLPWGVMMAGALMGSIPAVLIYALSQKWVVSGLSAGAVKG